MFNSGNIKRQLINLPNLRRAGNLHKPLPNIHFSSDPHLCPQQLLSS
jgi:hypothetical protein